ncbi:MAG TPA: hypothetical protein VFV50_12645 [Bdellovibrionales bacterium]|nr:hypothetical protein [Bdellovibrionales bacterium]
MTRYGRYALNVLLAIALAFAAIAVLNAFDEELKPEVKALLERKYEIPETARHGFELVMQLGRSIGSGHPCVRGVYCTREELGQDAGQIDRYLRNNEAGIRRFQELLEVGSYGRGEPPKLGKYVSVIELLELSKAELLIVNQLLHKNELAAAARRLVRLRSFFLESMKYPQVLIEALISAAVLRNIGEFSKSAAVAHPKLTAQLQPVAPNAWPDFHDVSERTVFMEAGFFHATIENAKGKDILSYASLSTGGKPTWIEDSLGRLAGLFMQPNASMNLAFDAAQATRAHPCVTGLEVCPSSSIFERRPVHYIVNPMGAYLVNMFSSQGPRGYEKLYESLQALRSAF